MKSHKTAASGTVKKTAMGKWTTADAVSDSHSARTHFNVSAPARSHAASSEAGQNKNGAASGPTAMIQHMPAHHFM